jgi:hypothetical protein
LGVSPTTIRSDTFIAVPQTAASPRFTRAKKLRNRSAGQPVIVLT